LAHSHFLELTGIEKAISPDMHSLIRELAKKLHRLQVTAALMSLYMIKRALLRT
jgi:hypothetical protein